MASGLGFEEATDVSYRRAGLLVTPKLSSIRKQLTRAQHIPQLQKPL
jgi:hypothetical protein